MSVRHSFVQDKEKLQYYQKRLTNKKHILIYRIWIVACQYRRYNVDIGSYILRANNLNFRGKYLILQQFRAVFPQKFRLPRNFDMQLTGGPSRVFPIGTALCVDMSLSVEKYRVRNAYVI